MAPTLLFRRPRPHLIGIDVLLPIMRAPGHHSHHVLGRHDRRKPTRPRPAHCTQYQPAARPNMREAIGQERRRLLNVFDDFEQSQHINAPVRCAWSRQILDRRVDVVEAAGFQQ